MGEASTDSDHQMSVKYQVVEDAGVDQQSTTDEGGNDEEADKEVLAKMQSLFQQVRKQIRSQAGTPKSSILELVKQVKDRQSELNGQSEESDPKEDVIYDNLDKKLDEAQKALRAEFEEKMTELRREMQAYTDGSLRDLEAKLQRPNQPESNEKPATSVRSKKERVLTRTMTTTFSKSSAPVAAGPRARSQTVTNSKGSQVLMRDVCKCHQSSRPLPPVAPPLQPRKKWVKAKPAK